MRKTFCVMIAAGMICFSACDSKQSTDSANVSPTLEEATSATDIAETTASPIDTAGVLRDTLVADTSKIVPQQ